ncbi:MAG: D-alanyl-D-alanine carboxypeptidase DacF [Alphaproteobacteria bacterium MarineAlpha11_Bin1]|nr:MAG: D-alanyl-D-alanine carboxypeptidase DacF [Alphaproteobacteria bacterium MarineAlpha11_Bin1]
MREFNLFRLLLVLISMSTIFVAGSLVFPGASCAKYAHIVVDAKTGRVLNSLNARTKNYPASLTKIMTLFMTFEALKKRTIFIDQNLPVSRVAQGRSPSRLGLRRGERITVNNSIKALVTKSANDVATVLAEAIGGTERKFAVMMTRRARALGMKNTTFKNASGLPNRAQLSTAEDMSILARAMLTQHPEMYHHFARQKFTYKRRTYYSHNRLLRNYKGMDGIKTGYIRASGFNLVASATRGGKRVIAVVFGGKTSKTRDRQVARLLDRGFKRLDRAGATSEKWKVATIRTSKRKISGASSPRLKKLVTGNPNKISSGKFVTPLRAQTGRVRSWAIQVGAYNRYGPAHLAVNRAARAVPSLLGNKFQILHQKSKARRGLKIYKARLLVSSESNARNSCRALKRRKIDCMVVWMGPKS